MGMDGQLDPGVVNGDVGALRDRVLWLEQELARREQELAEHRRDLQGLHEREARLAGVEEDRKRLAAVAESSADFIGIASMEGKAQYLNEAGRQLVGIADGGLDDVEVSSFFFPEDLRYAMDHIIPETVKHGRWIGEFRFRHFTTGAPIPVLYNSFLIKDPDSGQPMALATVSADLTERKREEEERVRLKDEVIRMQAAMLRELSTPLLRISDRAVLMPLVGAIDAGRAAAVLERVLQGVSADLARVVLLDITGVSNVDTHVADALLRTARAVRLLGAQMVLTGIRPEVAQVLVGLGVDLRGIVTLGSLQSGIAFAIQQAQ
ncbi:STAS domain-containing protein [Sorangium sp. So ce233]|uniref:STAS domain-containing protein n=1 Tax=Sorangium sp. So ce233 TaxID=3133290 RepID=UPI003F5DCCA9